MQFTRVRITLRMGGVTAVQGAVEVTGSHGVQLIGEFVVDHAGLNQGQGASGVGQHVGVGTALDNPGARVRPGRNGLAQGGAHRGCADPAIAIPAGLPVAQRDSVHHASPVNQW